MNSIHILLIEDNPSDVLLIKTLMAREQAFPHTTKAASSLGEGLALMVGQAFDLVLTDLGLPDGQGLATVAKLREASPHLPIIVLTGDDDLETALMAIKMGAQDFLPKEELSGFILCRTIRYAIEREKLVGQLQAALVEVKTLSGMLPICYECKQIRDDKGYWNQIETYIKKHTNARFSHGLCPDCAQKYFVKNNLPVPEDLRHLGLRNPAERELA